MIEINKQAYLVNFNAPDGRRSYGVADKEALAFLLGRLFPDRPFDSFPLDERGLPTTQGLVIAAPFHIYQSECVHDDEGDPEEAPDEPFREDE